MAKRSGRDRNRDAARGGDHGGGRAGRGNRKLARELGQTSKQLDQARSVEAKRLRQLDEAAAEVARLEGELRRIEAELAGAGAAASSPPPAPAPAAPPSKPGSAPGKGAAPAPVAPAQPERAVPADPEPSAAPRESATSATSDAADAFAPTVSRPTRRGRAAQAASLEAELARLDAAREGDLRGTTVDEPEPADELEPERAREPGRPPALEPLETSEVDEAADADADDEDEAADADDEDGLVIRLGAGTQPMLDAGVSDVAPSVVPEAPAEAAEVAEADGGWTAGSGLPFRSGRNGSTAPADRDASDARPSISPESGRREPVEAPDPTARSWPQRRQQRARS